MEAKTDINQNNDVYSIEQDDLSLFQACLNEFKALDYNDSFLDEIRVEVCRIKSANKDSESSE